MEATLFLMTSLQNLQEKRSQEHPSNWNTLKNKAKSRKKQGMHEQACRKTSGVTTAHKSAYHKPQTKLCFVCFYSCVHYFLVKFCGRTKVLFLTNSADGQLTVLAALHNKTCHDMSNNYSPI